MLSLKILAPDCDISFIIVCCFLIVLLCYNLLLTILIVLISFGVFRSENWYPLPDTNHAKRKIQCKISFLKLRHYWQYRWFTTVVQDTFLRYNTIRTPHGSNFLYKHSRRIVGQCKCNKWPELCYLQSFERTFLKIKILIIIEKLINKLSISFLKQIIYVYKTTVKSILGRWCKNFQR
jgi:hypothetical protein